MKYAYYMIYRPAMPGAMPREGLVEIENLDADGERQYVPQIDSKAYSRIIYNRPLTRKEIRAYELIPEEYTVPLTRAEIQHIRGSLCHMCDVSDDQQEIDELCAIYAKMKGVEDHED